MERRGRAGGIARGWIVRAHPRTCRDKPEIQDLTFDRGRAFQTAALRKSIHVWNLPRRRGMARHGDSLAGALQHSHLDVYLNGAKRIANGKFVRARGEESGILNDDAENN